MLDFKLVIDNIYMLQCSLLLYVLIDTLYIPPLGLKKSSLAAAHPKRTVIASKISIFILPTEPNKTNPKCQDNVMF